ncbi:MAG: hypothetical protein JO128_00200 [Alphaproteobacteria bacterium]|nr:hypothetical protein [Alphaproteobacteria bacterium]
MTNEHDRRARVVAQPIGPGRRGLLPQRLVRRRTGHRFEFDALAAYLGLLIGAGLGGIAASPSAVPIIAGAAAQLCAVGALEVGRDGTAECLPP